MAFRPKGIVTEQFVDRTVNAINSENPVLKLELDDDVKSGVLAYMEQFVTKVIFY